MQQTASAAILIHDTDTLFIVYAHTYLGIQ